MIQWRQIALLVLVLGGLGGGLAVVRPQEGRPPLGKSTLALQWLTQCQFAGYYVALEKGWYWEEGIDLTILPGAADINPINLVQAGEADFGAKWLADLMAACSRGYPLVSLAQIFKSNGLVLPAKAKSGLTRPQDLTE